ncbi:DUF4233 domain-containing protein [Motilibacter aurantiacus]|uniref:DUF4233 domain-containing protein n=1 Tax=Motilibacter aurantiacus TaxID=2714955 RepID=UPI00140DFF24|nr:DUF4233 domain-containing protein [Motilibacter aurantiacus]
MRRSLAAIVLTFEAFVVFFAMLVAANLSDLPTGPVVATGLALAAACLVVTGLLRHRWAYGLGSLLQVAIVATGFVVPAMWLLGPVFAAMWFGFMVLSTRVERAARASAGVEPAAGAR